MIEPRPDLSVVFPVYNEEENVPILLERDEVPHDKVAQAVGIDLTIGQQLGLLAIMLVMLAGLVAAVMNSTPARVGSGM